MPRFFKHNKLGSFQQQLLTYGFTRVPNESCLDISTIWQHAKFIQGRPELLEQIQRAAGKGNKDDKAGVKRDQSGERDGGNGHVDEDGDGDGDVSEQFQAMQSHLARLGQSVQELHAELRAAREYEMKVLEELVRRVDRRSGKGGSGGSGSSASPETAQSSSESSPPKGDDAMGGASTGSGRGDGSGRSSGSSAEMAEMADDATRANGDSSASSVPHEAEAAVAGLAALGAQ